MAQIGQRGNFLGHNGKVSKVYSDGTVQFGNFRIKPSQLTAWVTSKPTAHERKRDMQSEQAERFFKQNKQRTKDTVRTYDRAQLHRALDAVLSRAKDFDLGATWDAADINRRRAWLEEIIARTPEASHQAVWNQLSKPWSSVSKPVKARLAQYAAAKILR